MNQHGEEIVNKILELKAKGLTHRQICTELGWRTSQNSTVCDIIKRNKNVVSIASANENDSISSVGKRIVFLDIERIGMFAQLYSFYPKFVSPSCFLSKQSFTLSFAWIALDAHEKEIQYRDIQGTFEPDHIKDLIVNGKIPNNYELVKEMWHVLDDADVIIGHNVKKFDVKCIRAEFLRHGLGEPSPFKQIDTLTSARSYFKFDSNSLAWLTDMFNVEFKKIAHEEMQGAELFLNCLFDDAKAWRLNEEYNKYDVLSNRELFFKLQPYCKLINLDVLHRENENVCFCGSKDFTKVEGKYYTTNTNYYQVWKCDKCGSNYHDGKGLKDKDKQIMRNI